MFPCENVKDLVGLKKETVAVDVKLVNKNEGIGEYGGVNSLEGGGKSGEWELDL